MLLMGCVKSHTSAGGNIFDHILHCCTCVPFKRREHEAYPRPQQPSRRYVANKSMKSAYTITI